jgi:NADH:ubiquinone oxidoreductase subunit F (NADH-binding)
VAELLPVDGIVDLEVLEPAESLEAYRSRKGYAALCRALTMSGAEIVEVVRQAGLRGHGGAGFPTARKWEAARQGEAPRYLVVNGVEGEPGLTRIDI